VVIGIEPLSSRRELARELGVSTVLDPSAELDLPGALAFHTAGLGADVMYLCAGVKDSRVTNGALAACRDRARVVMIGDMGLDLDRGPLFRKELVFRVSRSYGPGRYEREYEGRGLDYPVGYVRWTEQRNLACFLDLLATGAVRVGPLISETVPVAEAPRAYDRLATDPERGAAVVLTYGERSTEPPHPSPVRRRGVARGAGQLRVGVIGCGAFVTANLLPHLGALGARLYGVANRSPAAFPGIASRYAPEILTTSADVLLSDSAVDAVIIGTRHNLHAPLAEAALRAGKPVHVEKPMAMTLAEAESLARLVREREGLLTIGYNRRFAPTVVALRRALTDAPRPRQFLYRVNATPLPPSHWTMDRLEGGGRLVGEGCHFIDLVCYLADSDIAEVSGGALAGDAYLTSAQDNFAMTLRFQNGDLATIVYSSQGSSELAKERLEVFAGGRVFVLDDFVRLERFGDKAGPLVLGAADKGFAGQIRNFLEAVRGREKLLTTVDDGVRVARVIDGFAGRVPSMHGAR
jgi:predicted dehydrogenase